MKESSNALYASSVLSSFLTRGGVWSMEDGGVIPAQLFTVIDPDGPIELALLIKRTGSPLAYWSRNGAAENVVTVMSATLMGSIETLVQAVGRSCPQVVSVETDDRYLFCTRVD